MRNFFHSTFGVLGCACAIALSSSTISLAASPATTAVVQGANDRRNVSSPKDTQGWVIAEVGRGAFTVHCPEAYNETIKVVNRPHGEVLIREISGKTYDQMSFRVSEIPLGFGLVARNLDEYVDFAKGDIPAIEQTLIRTNLKDYPAIAYSHYTATGIRFRYVVFLDDYCIEMDLLCRTNLADRGETVAKRFISSLRTKESARTDDFKLLGLRAPSIAEVQRLPVPDRQWLSLDYELASQMLGRGEAFLPRLTTPVGARFWKSLTSPDNLTFADNPSTPIRDKVPLLRSASRACNQISNMISEAQIAFGGYEPELYTMRAYQLRILTKNVRLDMEYAAQTRNNPAFPNNLPLAFLGEAAVVSQKSGMPTIQNTLLDAMKDALAVISLYWATDQREAIASALAKAKAKTIDQRALTKIDELLKIAQSRNTPPGEMSGGPDFKSLRWGSNLDQVMAAERVSPLDRTSSRLIYKSSLGGGDAALIYYFDGAPPALACAVSIMYRPIEREEDLRRAFDNAKEELANMYGAPSGEQTIGAPPGKDAAQNLRTGKTIDGRAPQNSGNLTHDIINGMPVTYYRESCSWRTVRSGVRLELEISSNGEGWVTLLEASGVLAGDVSIDTTSQTSTYTAGDRFKDLAKRDGTHYAGKK